MLVVDGLVKRFGGNVAVNRATLEVGRGTIVGLIGINGAGKSTLMNCIAGMYRADEGRVEFDGQNLIGLTPHEIAAAGIVRTFQVPRTFERLTLIDNLMIPMLNRPESEDELIALAEAGLAEVNLHDLKMNNGEELSGGQQKLLELASVMMLEPKLILLDEPFAGVNPTLCTLITDKILQMKEAGISFLLVSHDLTSIYRLSDHIYVLNQGEVICEGGVDDIRDDPKVVEAYLGG
ncbi:MAG: ABC transporter ATP-binding protein [Alphaproteobacteria bacterium]|nr:ABC transporter ATP-binding protein [Alphaproteobacteria bacterium]